MKEQRVFIKQKEIINKPQYVSQEVFEKLLKEFLVAHSIPLNRLADK